jgi:hypothetical protein
MEKTIKITPPEGYIIDKDNSTFEQIVFKKGTILPRSWTELETITGYYVTSSSIVCPCTNEEPTNTYNKNIFSTKHEAEASIALAQLSQLRKVYRNGWEFELDGKVNYAIYKYGGNYKIKNIINEHHYLSFQHRETAELFLNNFKHLIEQASPLLF